MSYTAADNPLVPETLRGKYLLRINLALEDLYLRVTARCHATLSARNSILVRRLVQPLPEPAKVADEVGRANIEQLFTAGPEELLKIYDYVSEPWRTVFLGSKPKSIEGIAWLVARNLDWYLVPPQPLLRPEWLAITGAAAGSLVLCAAIAALIIGTPISALTSLSVIAFLVLQGLAWRGVAAEFSGGFHRQRVYIDALRRHVRSLMYGADGSGMPDAQLDSATPVEDRMPRQDVTESLSRAERLLDQVDDETGR